MRLKRTLAIAAVVGVLSTGLMAPAPARADNTALIVIASISAYVGVLLVATYLVYRTPPPDSFAAMPVPPEDDRRTQPPVKLAPRCAQQSGGLTLVCW